MDITVELQVFNGKVYAVFLNGEEVALSDWHEVQIEPPCGCGTVPITCNGCMWAEPAENRPGVFDCRWTPEEGY